MKDNEQTEKKKHKKRTKLLVSQLKEQVEFYFSDSNLQKDRFLKKEISKTPSGYVEVQIVASFNRMKQMTDDIKLVLKAIKASTLLELNSDETMVRRTTPIPEQRNVDAETVYVEKLPSHADHDWLRKMFSQFGRVQYVSLPRFRHNGETKGFAFIEFETAKEAEDAVQMFNKDVKGKKEKEEKTTGEQSSDEQSSKVRKRRRSHSESELESSKQSAHKPERKRRRTISESSMDSGDNLPNLKDARNIETIREESEGETNTASDDHKGRKRKKNVQWEEEKTEAAENIVNKDLEKHDEENGDEQKSKKRKNSESDGNGPGSEEEGNTDGKRKKKSRKRKAKEKKGTTRIPHLRVISKLEWLKLKGEYKKLQRESMQALKKQLQEHSDKPTTSETTKQTSKDNQTHKTRESSKQEKQEKEEKQEQPKLPAELPFTPGVVLKFQSLDTELTTKEIRKRFAAHGPVAYVEMEEDTGEGFVRFHTPENCSALLDTMSADSNASAKLSKLTDEEEHNYWKKINADRVARFQAKREKKRGTEKVARKADALQAKQLSKQVHIRFDNDT